MTHTVFYKDHRFLIPMSFALLLTIVGIIIALATADFGFETYWGAMVFFPYIMLSVVPFGVIPPVIALLSFIQYPNYGLLAWYCWRSRKWWPMLILLLMHLIASGAAFWFIKYEPKYRFNQERIILIERRK